MSVYPFEIDDDTTIIRVDDNITEVGGDAINQLREAVFAIENELGIDPSGSLNSVADRLNVSINPNGTIKASALASVGLVTLPITDVHVGLNAGIKESKLTLNYSTSDLHTLIMSNTALLNSLVSFTNTIFSDLHAHISGASLLADGTSSARHVGTHIDLNAVPTDPRDPTFTWAGLKDRNGVMRAAKNVGEALDEINTAFINHENNITGDAHFASGIGVNTDNFIEIPKTATDAQKAFQAIDDYEVINIGQHRATQHANAVPKITRSQGPCLPDGYKENVVPPTPVVTYLVHPPKSEPVDSLTIGDDLVVFDPDNTDFVFDSQFGRVKSGDVITINYGNGVSASYIIDSLRYTPDTTWVVRLNGVNLYDSDGYNAYARIDRPLYDTKTAGVLAVAAANATPVGSFDYILSSAIVGNPRGAMAIGLGFDAGQLDNEHYNLYLELYPTGNPAEHVIFLPGIDVTGNGGTTPGDYTLETVVQETNNKLREMGYNYRFIAFAHEGEFGIMLADAINCASFAIIKGVNSSGTLTVSGYTENVIGEAAGDTFDALGLGATHADEASPAYQGTFSDEWAAQMPTKVIVPLKQRYYIVNGRKRDDFAETYNADGEGYWDGYIYNRNPIGPFTVETTYSIPKDLKAAELKPGKTIVVQPSVDFADPLYYDVDYGRFIIKEVVFNVCVGTPDQTLITVINSIHGTGVGFGFSSEPPLPVRIYFSEDSVSFNNQNVIDVTTTSDKYRRLHEVYVTEEGKTFSHERARMPDHAEQSAPSPPGGLWLSTTNWHIVNVSSKLRGYRDSTTTFNKYIRFYIHSYDTTSGEFIGQIGQRDPASGAILSTGPMTYGRKDAVTRFYDETNLDYIDLKFVDVDNTSPGNFILSDGAAGGGGTPRYVDIELFSSLQQDDEIMLLATCEVNWDRIINSDIVEHVVDKRQFGSVDETDFTKSALDYISAGDRLLHENGVVRGLDFDYINPTDNREIFFKGGIALVNGHISTVNNLSVTIPEIFPESPPNPAPPVTVDWAVCVNEENQLESILLTTTKVQYFAESNQSGNVYYVPSVTFTELVNTRKDLTPIAIVTSLVASTTITPSDVDDVRKFVDSSNALHSLVWSTEDFVGNFHTIDAIKAWVNNYDVNYTGGVCKIRVRGAFDVDASLDLTGFLVPVIFEGDGAIFTVTTGQGLLVDSLVTLRNMHFVYDPTGLPAYTANDHINTGNGCIYRAGQGGAGSGADPTLSHSVTIEDCSFTSTLTTQRPPFISIELNKDDIVSNYQIRNNIFNDANNATAKIQAAIALVDLEGGIAAVTGPAVAHNCIIENNKCNYAQGIYVTAFAETPTNPANSTDITGYGLRPVNVDVINNHCGVIGFLVSSTEVTNSSLLSGTDFTSGLRISNNTCHFIGTITHVGAAAYYAFATTDVAEYSLGNVAIDHNKCNWIHCATSNITSPADRSGLSITNNILRAHDFAGYLEPTFWYWSSASTYMNRAISVIPSDSNDAPNAVITGNNIDQGVVDGTDYWYNWGIYSYTPSTISNNIIKGFVIDGTFPNNGVGIHIGKRVGVISQGQIVTGNELYRGYGTSIEHDVDIYIETGGDPNSTRGVVVGNFVDSSYVDVAATDDRVIAAPSSWTVGRNKNQLGTAYIGGMCGQASVGLGSSSYGDINTGRYDSWVEMTDRPWLDIVAQEWHGRQADSNVMSFDWIVDLNEYLPHGVYILDVSSAIYCTNGSPTQSGTLYVRDMNNIGTNTTVPIGTGTSPTPTVLSVSAYGFNTCEGAPIYAKISTNADLSSGNRTFYVYRFEVNYRW